MKARALFRRFTLREKGMLCLFVWVILLICFGFALRNFRAFWAEWSRTGQTLAQQTKTLNLAPEVDAQLAVELEFFNSDRTFDSASLAGRVDSLARQTGINLVNFNTKTDPRDIYDQHVMRLTIRDTPLEKLMAFDAALEQESPYINQKSVSLDADRRNPQLIDATIELNSFELKSGEYAVP